MRQAEKLTQDYIMLKINDLESQKANCQLTIKERDYIDEVIAELRAQKTEEAKDPFHKFKQSFLNRGQ